MWKVNANNQDANRWISGVAGDKKTLSEAQAIVDVEITQAQTDWDALSDQEKATTSRPENITLTE